MKYNLTFIKLFLILLLVSQLNAQQYDALINLGGDCQPSFQMYQHGLRKYALPFDTLMTPCDSITQMLESQFADFLNKENLELISKENEKFILDKKYNVRLIHDFKLEENYLDDYESIKEKYDRRIARLIQLLNTSNSVLFIRKNINREQALHLASSITSLYPRLQFTILALDTTNEIKEPWKLEHVHNRFLKQPDPYVWKGDTDAWKKILLEMGLELSDSESSTKEH